MIIKNLYWGLGIVFLLTGCATINKGDDELIHKAMVDRDYQNIDTNLKPVSNPMPFKVQTVSMYDKDTKTYKEIPIDSLSKEQIRTLLSHTTSKITIEKKDVDGQFSYIHFGSTLQKGEYKITYDFTNSFNQSFELKDGIKTIGEFGVGVRLIAEIKTKSKSANVNGLIPLFISAKDNKLSGSISYSTYGIKHPKISVVAPATLDLSEGSIQKVFDAIATTRVLVDLDETTLEPNLLAYIPISNRNY